MADYMSHGTEEQKWHGTDHVWPSSRDTTGAVVTDLSIYHGHNARQSKRNFRPVCTLMHPENRGVTGKCIIQNLKVPNSPPEHVHLTKCEQLLAKKCSKWKLIQTLRQSTWSGYPPPTPTGSDTGTWLLYHVKPRGKACHEVWLYPVKFSKEQ